MSHAALNPEQFHFMEGRTGPHFLSTGGDEPVGRLLWHSSHGEIENLEVEEGHQRQGVATALYRHAQHIAAEKDIVPPRHSEIRSDAGDAWAQSTGEALPERRYS